MSFNSCEAPHERCRAAREAVAAVTFRVTTCCAPARVYRRTWHNRFMMWQAAHAAMPTALLPLHGSSASAAVGRDRSLDPGAGSYRRPWSPALAWATSAGRANHRDRVAAAHLGGQ